MNRPFIQIDNIVREMTEQEYQDLLDSGWVLEEEQPIVGGPYDSN